VAVSDEALLRGYLKKLDREDRALDPERYRRKAAAILDQLLPMQRTLAEDWHKRLCLLTPGKNGKTFTVRARLLRGALLKKNFVGVYVGITRADAKKDMWDGDSGLRHLCELLGLKIGQVGDTDVDVIFNSQDLTATFPQTGALIWVGGADNMKVIENYRGGHGYDEFWIDEAKSHSPRLLQVLIEDIVEPRVNWRDGVIGICGTPGSILKGYFYELTRPQSELSVSCTDENPDPLLWNRHNWSLEQNTIRLEGQTTSAWERALALKKSKKWTDRNTVWRREYLGQWCAELTSSVYKFQQHDEEGNPWNIWTPKVQTKEEARTNPFGLFSMVKVGDQWQPIVWQFGIGMDMGESDLFALEVFAFSAQLPGRLYQVHEVVKRFRLMDTPDGKPFSRVDFIGQALVKAIELIKFYADYPSVLVSDMAHMGEAILTEVLIKYGHKVTKASKQDKEGGISLVNDDLIDGRMLLLAGSKLAEQMSELQYDETGKREMPGQPNDACDGTLYLRVGLIPFFSHTEPAPLPEAEKHSAHVTAVLKRYADRARDGQLSTYDDLSPYDPRT
jgi:hypothetical protein